MALMVGMHDDAARTNGKNPIAPPLRLHCMMQGLVVSNVKQAVAVSYVGMHVGMHVGGVC